MLFLSNPCHPIIDYGRAGIPAMLVARNMDLIKKGRLEFYNKSENR